MNIILKRVVNKKKVAQITVLIIAVLFAVKGIVTVVNETISYTNNHLDAYSVSRVESRHLIEEKTNTVKIEVPVIKETSVANLTNLLK